ncbi:MAG: replication-associated recombination protein A [Bacteroidales bacterium]|nr:replication-associated recombination protein A [Bacteroidales bacterium]
MLNSISETPLSAQFSTVPLAERLRPTNIEEYIGQQHLVGAGAVISTMLKSGNISSFILWGPPGVGKTTLARIVAKSLNRQFFTLSAISSGVKDVREVIDRAEKERMFAVNGSPILFIDEIHRFNKAQQDALLGAVESGSIVLIGATTENPSFEVISPLLSRCQVYILKPLEISDLTTLLNRAKNYLADNEHIILDITETEALFRFSGGDARKLLNILDLAIKTLSSKASKDGGNLVIQITNELIVNLLQENIALYDKNGEQHYDIISAFIKSMRGSDPNGAIYWMARMLAGGEDPLFIARRMLILAAEDIGLANPNALLLAQSCFDAVHKVGMPEARIILSETCIYLATSPKSNSAITAIDTALELVNSTSDAPAVPLHLRNAPTKLMKELGYARNYKYAHSYAGNFVDQEFLPQELVATKFYDPGDNPKENEIRKRLSEKWKKYKYNLT